MLERENTDKEHTDYERNSNIRQELCANAYS